MRVATLRISRDPIVEIPSQHVHRRALCNLLKLKKIKNKHVVLLNILEISNIRGLTDQDYLFI